jgi:mRNA interferase MazF
VPADTQRGERFAVIVRARRFGHLSTWLAVPTSTSAGGSVYRPRIDVSDHGSTLALCEALNAIDPGQRLGELVGGLSFAEMQEIDAALRLLLDLDLSY